MPDPMTMTGTWHFRAWPDYDTGSRRDPVYSTTGQAFTFSSQYEGTWVPFGESELLSVTARSTTIVLHHSGPRRDAAAHDWHECGWLAAQTQISVEIAARAVLGCGPRLAALFVCADEADRELAIAASRDIIRVYLCPDGGNIGMAKLTKLDDIVSLCKRRGFIFQSSEIYGGLASCYDYGPLGVELKNNVKRAWWKNVVQMRDDVVGLDCQHPHAPADLEGLRPRGQVRRPGLRVQEVQHADPRGPPQGQRRTARRRPRSTPSTSPSRRKRPSRTT